MNPPRLVLVTRRFWPLVGGAELMMARLAAEFKRRGLAVTLLTAQWQPEWPAEIEHHGVRVIRLPNPAWRWWGTWRYMAALAGWLRRHAAQHDLVYVSMLKHDAYAALGVGQASGTPVVVRAEGAGLTGDCNWQLEARGGLRIKRRCQRAAALVAPSPAIERELIAAGYSRPRIRLIPNGVSLPRARTPKRRQEARQALAGSHPGLQLAADTALAVYTGRLHVQKGLADLVRAWAPFAAARPEARLWLVGEGDERQALATLINDLGLAGQVVLAGAFDDVEDVLAAADLFVLPSRVEGMSVSLLEAMAAELPVAASDISANRILVRDGNEGRLVPLGDLPAWMNVFEELLPRSAADRARVGDVLGQAGRRRVADQYALSHTVDLHLALFEQLLAERSARRP